MQLPGSTTGISPAAAAHLARSQDQQSAAGLLCSPMYLNTGSSRIRQQTSWVHECTCFARHWATVRSFTGAARQKPLGLLLLGSTGASGYYCAYWSLMLCS